MHALDIKQKSRKF